MSYVPSSPADRKSTRLNSSHVEISYAVFCLKKKKKPFNMICKRLGMTTRAPNLIAEISQVKDNTASVVFNAIRYCVIAALEGPDFFFKDPPTTEIYTLSLHDALPIATPGRKRKPGSAKGRIWIAPDFDATPADLDRKSTRLNSSHVEISYAVFCLKKKKKKKTTHIIKKKKKQKQQHN